MPPRSRRRNGMREKGGGVASVHQSDRPKREASGHEGKEEEDEILLVPVSRRLRRRQATEIAPVVETTKNETKKSARRSHEKKQASEDEEEPKRVLRPRGANGLTSLQDSGEDKDPEEKKEKKVIPQAMRRLRRRGSNGLVVVPEVVEHVPDVHKKVKAPQRVRVRLGGLILDPFSEKSVLENTSASKKSCSILSENDDEDEHEESDVSLFELDTKNDDDAVDTTEDKHQKGFRRKSKRQKSEKGLKRKAAAMALEATQAVLRQEKAVVSKTEKFIEEEEENDHDVGYEDVQLYQDTDALAHGVVSNYEFRDVSASPSKKDVAKKFTERDAAMTSCRRLRPALKDPGYDMELVPNAIKSGAGSYLRRLEGHYAWEELIAEMVLLCGEAAWRRMHRDTIIFTKDHSKSYIGPPPDAKPLMLEYISDRVDTDDPIFGFELRTLKQDWLQGFAMCTTFTTWTPYFRFTNRAPAAAVTLDDIESHRVADDSLVNELESCRRAGDYEAEGVVWPKVAELSLLGGLGAGGILAQVVLDTLATAKSQYDFVVLQATDQAIPFYEKLGFERIGAVASFESPKAGVKLAVETNGEKGAIRLPSSQALAQKPAGAKLYWARRYARLCLKQVSALDIDSIFSIPVTDQVAPGYSSLITNPMDLSMMRRKMVDGTEPIASAKAYLCPELRNDIQLMIDNCLFYNHVSSPVAAYAKRFRDKVIHFLDEAKEKRPDLYYDTDDDRDGTILEYEQAADADTAVLGYVHWTFPDQPVEDQYPSYLMAKRLRPHGTSAARALALAADEAFSIADHAQAAAAVATRSALDACSRLPLLEEAKEENLHQASSNQENGENTPIEPMQLVETEEVTTPASSLPPKPIPTCWSLPLDLGLARLTPNNAIPAPPPPLRKRIVPRSNITPRGSAGYTAKIGHGMGVEYLGIFESASEAQKAYNNAKILYENTSHTKPVLGNYEPKGQSNALRDELLARAPTPQRPPLPMRAADLSNDAEINAEKLRELAAAVPTETAPRSIDLLPTKKRQVKLYNKVVHVKGLPPCYPHVFWFVYQYVPDMEWCHLCPMEPFGSFGLKSKREGRPRWRLVPEGRAREIDVPAARCTPVRHQTVAKTQSADREVFDIIDTDAIARFFPDGYAGASASADRAAASAQIQ